MTQNEFILADRITKIQSTVNQYGQDSFYISYSGGKDSVVLSHLVDLAIPGNQIPRVYIDTGIDLYMIRDFVRDQKQKDPRIQIVSPKIPIKKTLETFGYPFKSKEFSRVLSLYQRKGMMPTVKKFLHPREDTGRRYQCPKSLTWMFSDQCGLRISDKCCYYMKEKPLRDWANEHHKKCTMTGIRKSEGGRREHARCITQRGRKVYFNPLLVVNDEWEEWFIREYSIEICGIYNPPYNFDRTGCKGCPFNIHIQRDLETLEKYFPVERKQCEAIWKPVYELYRKMHYRLKDKNL